MPTQTNHQALIDTLKNRFAITSTDAQTLRRIAMTLHRWYEKECGDDHGCIERDEATGTPYWLDSRTMRRSPIRDMERGALKRLEFLLARYADGMGTARQTLAAVACTSIAPQTFPVTCPLNRAIAVSARPYRRYGKHWRLPSGA